ncbi:MAG: PD40 domain-containing protein [Chloroflexi bacterium]|nr:PD40 domain-containing protein [Chloroflexota bacterium]
MTPGAANNLRTQPSAQSDKIGQIPGGDEFKVLDGPVCGDGYSWWQIEYNALVGWTPESSGDEYWLEPIATSMESIVVSPTMTSTDLPTVSPTSTPHPYYGIGRIAFIARNSFGFAIYAINSDGTNLQQLSKSMPDEAFPQTLSWSPDGKYIAFDARVPYESELELMEILVLEVVTGEITQLTHRRGLDHSPQFSPDGTKILYAAEVTTNQSEIFVMDSDGSNVQQLSHLPSDNSMSASWSPDGNQIAFASDYNGNFDIYVMDANGENPRQLTLDRARDLAPSWLPSGLSIRFASNRDGDQLRADLEIWSTYVIPVEGGNPRRLITGGGYSWSSDGKYMAYLHKNPDNNIRGLYVTNGNKPVLIYESTFDMMYSLNWQP